MTALRAAGCALLMVASVTASAQQGIFRGAVDIVELEVSVMRGRVPVPGLTVTDFDLRDNGVRQTLISAVLNPQPIRVTLVLDVSSSVVGERLENLVRAGRALAASLRPDEQASLITCSHHVALRVPMGKSGDPLREALSGLEAGGSTALRDAVDLALTLESDQRTGSLVLLFSDGADTASWLTRPQVLEAARRSGSVIHGVRVGSDPLIGQLTDATGGRTWSVGSDRELEETLQRILDEMRARYVLTYSPAESAKKGWARDQGVGGERPRRGHRAAGVCFPLKEAGGWRLEKLSTTEPRDSWLSWRTRISVVSVCSVLIP